MNSLSQTSKKTECRCQARVWGATATGNIQCTKIGTKNGLCKNHYNAEKDRNGKVWSFCNPNEECKKHKRWWGRITQNIDDFTVEKNLTYGKPVVVARWKGKNGELISPHIIEKVHKGEWIFHPFGYKKGLARMNPEKKVNKSILYKSKIEIREVCTEDEEIVESLYHEKYEDGILVKTYSMEVYINDGHDEIEPDNFIGYWENGVGIVTADYYEFAY